MKYKKDNYSLVNEKIVKGIIYTVWRCNDKPKKTIMTHEGKTVELDNLKETWRKLK